MSKRGGGGGRGRGGKRNMKGRNRQFNNPEEMERQLKEERESWREPKEGEEGSGDEQQPVAQRGAPGELPPSDSDSEESSSDEEPGKAKGVEGLIEISNPNRAVKKTTKAVNVDVNKSGTSALTRREREQIEKEQARQRYNKLHSEGKTTEAQGDLARLAIIRKQREEAAKKKEQEKIAADAKAKARKK